MTDIATVLDTLDMNRDAAIERLFELLRIPSISTDPAYADDCVRAAEWLATDLKSIGFSVRVNPTGGHPIVLATDHMSDGPHVLFYGHYDVQPVDPLELWDTPPFEPSIGTREDGTKELRGRGTADDKGQLMTFVEACRAWKSATGGLPCKVTILLEGEEESGGAHLPGFLESHKDLLAAADIALVCDTSMWDSKTPAICTSLRGLLGEEVIVHAASRDLHSGSYGGAAANPITMLTQALGALHDDHGRVVLPGFYDGVPETPEEIKAQWDALDFSDEAFLGSVGLRHPAGEVERTTLEQIWARPTAEINGIVGGYTGDGFKTVIPAEARAKVSFRLVGDQDPMKIRESFREFIRSQIRPDCSVEFVDHGTGRGIAMPTDAPAFEKAREALSDEWQTEAVFIGGGGSIPVVGDFKRILGLDSLLIGFGLDDDRLHSPNEKYDMRSFTGGARSWARVLDAIAEN